MLVSIRAHLFGFGLLAACASSSPAPEKAAPASAAPIAKPAPIVAAEPSRAVVPEVRSSTASRAEPTPPEPAPPAPPKPRTEPLKLLILGDSMAATDFGHALEEVLAVDPRISTARKGKSSTGLARPDFFDWMDEGPKQVDRHKPDLVLVILGGNDGQDLLQKKPGQRVFWGSKTWPEAYAERLLSLARRLGSERRPIVFLGLPLMDRPGLEKKLKLIRQVQEKTFSQHPGTHYLDTRSCFETKSGKLLREVEVKGWKKPQPLRQQDGIHLTVPGARHFAACTARLLKPLLDEAPAPGA